jgi:hypothetical protein
MQMQQQQEQQQMQMQEMMAMMMSSLEAMGSMHQPQLPDPNMAQQIQVPEVYIPEVYREPSIDWTEKQNQLAAKAKADYNLDQTRQKGRADTVLTSPILDEDEVKTTGSILGDG